MKDNEIEIIEIDDIEELEKPKKKVKKGAIITFIVLDFLAVLGLFFTYGPIDYFRNYWVTTAMRTQSHKYLARIFYSSDTIQEIMANNCVLEINDSTNVNDIVFGSNEDPGVYESIYEEQILKRDSNNNDYKIIDISGTDHGMKYRGYLVAIYDPSRVELATAKKLGVIGQRLREITKDNNAILGINASGFIDRNEQGMGGEPTGIIIKDGKFIWGSNDVTTMAGFNKDNVLVLKKETPKQAVAEGIRDAVDFGPFLIINGQSAIVKGNGGWGYNPRTVLAQRKDGIVLFMVIDGRQPGYSIGISIPEVIKILTRYRAHNAVNMDGGASSALVVNNELYSKPCAYNETGERWLPDAWILK